jgi:L-aminopeptidase/D-esterase-like protein
MLTDIPGLRVGQISDFDGITGCTAIVCDAGAVGGIDVRGWASGGEETGTLAPGHITDRVHAIVLAGGSAFGLEAASGVRRQLAGRGIGFAFGGSRVPIVAAAILFDLGIGKPEARPNLAMGEAAAAAATTGVVKEGSVGAGTGATVGKMFGMGRAMKGGVGTFTVALPGGVLVSALVAVNAFGDVCDPRTGKIVAGARKAPNSREFAGTEQEIKRRPPPPEAKGGNTTLAVVATNAKLNKVEAGRLAQAGGLGMARAIRPVNTTVDGDTVFALSAGNLRADGIALGVAAAEAVAESIVRAVRAAATLGGVPGLG